MGKERCMSCDKALTKKQQIIVEYDLERGILPEFAIFCKDCRKQNELNGEIKCV